MTKPEQKEAKNGPIGSSSAAEKGKGNDNTISDFLHGDGRFSLSTEIRAFFTMMSFVTRLPVPVTCAPDLHPGFVMKGMSYICLVGTLIGMVLALFLDALHAGATLGLPLILAACFMTIMNEFYLTGCFHSDGLADAADGIGGGWTTRRILQIMTDSRIGTFGCAAYCLYCMTKIHLLNELGTSQWNISQPLGLLQQGNDSSISSNIVIISHGAGPAILVSQALSRLSAPFLIRTREYIDDSTGPKTAFYSFFVQAKHLVSWYRVVVSIAICWIVTAVTYGRVLATVLVTIVLCTSHFFAGSYADYWLGGVMGDYLGATICCTEILCLTLLLLSDIHQEFLQENVVNMTLEKLLAMTWNERLFRFHHADEPYSESFMALARFLGVAIFLRIWCCTVGHERVMLRDWPPEASANQQQDSATVAPKDCGDGAKEVVLLDENATAAPPLTDLSPKQFAQATLASPTSLFSERYHAVQSYIDTLAKPVGSLGTLEDWAARLAALQRTISPMANPVACLIFAADHGAAKAVDLGGEACSLYPPAVTRSILQGLQRGIAGASILAKEHHVMLRVVDVGVASLSAPSDDVKQDSDANMSSFSYDHASGTVRSSLEKLVGGTRNFCTQASMTMEECERCIQMGRDEFSHYVAETKATIVALGEVGIGNTAASSALIAHFSMAKVESVCGSGATTASQSANDASIHKKIQLVKKALKLHGNAIKKSKTDSVKEALARLGGAEIAALVGAMLEAAERGNIAILVDGFIVTAAALVAIFIDPLAVSRVLFLTTQSAERGHDVAIATMQQLVASTKEKGNGTASSAPQPPPPTLIKPALNMNLRMGEATAALLAVPLIRSAAAMLSMGTIDDILAGEASEKD
jgi:nicotinate-nucleotide--dimethylbenzimidazole phosphoribosyltransferase